jgi:hypothetical protein
VQIRTICQQVTKSRNRQYLPSGLVVGSSFMSHILSMWYLRRSVTQKNRGCRHLVAGQGNCCRYVNGHVPRTRAVELALEVQRRKALRAARSLWVRRRLTQPPAYLTRQLSALGTPAAKEMPIRALFGDLASYVCLISAPIATVQANFQGFWSQCVPTL